MALGDIVVCPVCAELAIIVQEMYTDMKYSAKVKCKECHATVSLLTPPQAVDTIKIICPKPPKKGQQEFGFVEEELKIPGEE